ncbi:MAG: hypothetical protein JNL79_04920 [Myxococcales bacterium]|nr:hypothetical protein [Myxococcales bacterium]
MSLARLLPFVAVAVLTASCSEDPKPTVSGGAVLRLQTPVCKDAAGAVTPCPERCNDGGTELKIAVESTEKNPDGSAIYKLILDNADGATVKCSISASTFDLTVGSATRGSLLLTGTLDPKSKVTSGTASTTKGTTTSLTVLTPGGNSYRQVTGKPACTVTVNENTGCTMGEGCFKATFACDYVYDRNLGGACGINSSGAASTFVQFANCEVN